MHAKSIFTSVSAAALMASVGIAYAAPQQTPQQNQHSWNQQHSSMTGLQSEPQQVASEAAMVLRHNAQGNMQSGQMQSGAESQQIPQQVIAAARCVAVFPHNATMTSMGATGTEKTAGDTTQSLGTMGNAGTTGGTAGSTYSGNSTGTNSSGMAETHTASQSERVGVASCRNDNGQWTSSSPVFVRISKLQLMNTSTEMHGNGAMSGETGENGSYANGSYAHTGTQTGTHTAETGQNGGNAYGTTGESGNTGNALVLVFVNDDAADTLQSGDFTLGDDVDVTAGPTDLQSGGTVSAPVLAYASNSEGGFTGVAVQGAQVQFDKQANQQIYGDDADPEDLLKGEGNNNQAQGHLTAFNQALNEFAPSSQYNSNTSIVK